MTDRTTLRNLQKVLSDGFNMDELHDLCFRLDENKDEFPHTLTPFINGFLDHLERRNKIPELLEQGRELRHELDWPQLPGARLGALRRAIGKQDSEEVDEIFPELITYLKRLENQGITAADEIFLNTLEMFGEGDISGAQLVRLWHKEQGKQQAVAGTELDYVDLADRLQHGEIVLFLGACYPPSMVDGLARAARLDKFQGSFSQICEFMESDGRQTLLRKISDIQNQESAQDDGAQQALYKLLADKVHQPQLLISATYGDALEKAFQARSKPFKLLTHSQDSGAASAGNVLIRDGSDGAPQLHTAEQLSELDPLKKGFSLIYKIRGCFSFIKSTPASDTLTLSERDYFRFAREFDRLMPAYLVRQLKGRSLWYFGHYPDGWEERLLIQVIQDKQPGRSLAIQPRPGSFAENYWKSRKIDLCKLEPKDFLDKLAEKMNG
ncbi:MAG: SIR2 family protein [Candidatus Accumulibacter meliphilus]|jgi:hypothetical protein|uniref:SIR2 family protein n=1 Tax=Candidatus Accumulibacter meliphilus TaxID=2211374 RepID=UPI002FC38EBB